MQSYPINAIIEVFAQDQKVKCKTTIVPETGLSKSQKEQLNAAVAEARRDGQRFWRQHHSGFIIRRECLIK